MARKTRIGLIGAILTVAALLLALPVAAGARDRNNDNIPDRWERKHDLSLKVNQARRDQDRDDLRNRGEFRARTDPHDADSDNDGTEDSDEGAGTIESYNPETGRLVINLFGDDVVSGFVTDGTEIECDNGDADGDEDGDGEGGDHGGPGDGEHEDHSGPGDGDEGNEEAGRAARSEDPEDSEDGEDEEEEQEEHEGDDDCEEEDDCSADDLLPGVTVQEARMHLSGDGVIFDEIELLAQTVE